MDEPAKPWGGWSTFEVLDSRRGTKHEELHFVVGTGQGPSICEKRPWSWGAPHDCRVGDAPTRWACVECWILASRVERERERRRVELPAAKP